MEKYFDIIIIGGGLSGFCLANQLIKGNPNFSILIIERNIFPYQEAAHKVGESTVELGGHYLRSILGLEQHLKDHHLPKAGLRFFFTERDNQNIENRFEMGSDAFPPTPSFQLDRGRLENFLYHESQRVGVRVIDGCSVQSCDFSTVHTVNVLHGNELKNFKGRWVIDASGRFSVIKRQLNLRQSNQHEANASWFRINRKIDIDDWFPSSWHYSDVPKGLRYYSTNHFMGNGYWVWIIPLASGSTSVGIVTDNKIHPYESTHKFTKALNWLEKYEPQCASSVRQNEQNLMDFRALRNFSYDCKQVFSEKKWCLTGEAGLFLDPFYSPGTDFIAISNTFITQLICAEQSQQPINLIAKQYQQLYFQMYKSALTIYQGQYAVMGNREVMVKKIIWDYAIYWGFTALLFIQNKLCDYEFLRDINKYLQQVDIISAKVQAKFLAESQYRKTSTQKRYLNTLTISELSSWQAELLENYDGNSLKNKIRENFCKIKEISKNIFH